ncbi:MAG: DUF58 domain-containing protein [Myxococcaceae bacterium]|nr:DUF58 domain-containing protein [Myxococcaceae bacterium]
MRPPRRLSVTRTGRTYLVVTVGVGLGALNTGNNLLYLLLGLLLSVIVVSGVLSERCLSDLTVRRLGAEAAHAGEPFAFRWALSRRRGLAFALTVSEVGAPLQGEGRLAALSAGAEQVVRADLKAPRRGPVPLTAVKVTTTFPLGLFAKSRVFPLEGTLLVYPARGHSCEPVPVSHEGPAGLVGSARLQDGTGDVAGLRELAEGGDARRIHWLKSASTGTLLRTEREREERRSFVLEVDPTLPLAALDRRCEELAAQAQRLLAEGHEVGLGAAEFRLRPAVGPGQLRRLLRALALVGHAPLAQEEAA